MIQFLNIAIGRGHPFYLDGIVELLKKAGGPQIEYYEVLDISRGQSLAAWRMAKWLYRFGSNDSVIGKWYNSIRDRSEYIHDSLAMSFLGRDIRTKFLSGKTPLVVSHPVLVGILSGRVNLLYQHGEVAVPPQAMVKGARFVFVPAESSAAPFLKTGYSPQQVKVSGLCIEPELVKQSEIAFHKRLNRIFGNRPLAGAFFSSGAEPAPHMKKLIAAAESVIRHGGRVIIFAEEKGQLEKVVKKEFDRTGVPYSLVKGTNNPDLSQIQAALCLFEKRSELDQMTARYFSNFDYFVAPSHERSNWALGLGLPMFILEPAIGPFAYLNRQAILQVGVGMSLKTPVEAAGFGIRLSDLQKSGKLAEMAESGWKRHPINGFQSIADFLINKYRSS